MEDDMKNEQKEESEVIKLLRDNYESKLTERDTEITELNKKHEEEITKLREEHIKQIRAILTGRDEKPDEEDKTDEELMVERLTEKFKKRR